MSRHNPTPSPIRRATSDDAGEMARLLTPLGYPLRREDVEAVWAAWSGAGDFALVAEGPDGLVGVVTVHRMHVLHRAKPVGRITALAVDEGARGRGLGRALVHAAEAALAEAGCGIVEVTSHRRRAEAHSFYEHLGYERTSHRFARVFR